MSVSFFNRIKGVFSSEPCWRGGAGAGVVLVDAGGRITRASVEAAPMLGTASAEALRGRPIASFFVGVEKERLLEAIAAPQAASIHVKTAGTAGREAMIVTSPDGQGGARLLIVDQSATPTGVLREERRAARAAAESARAESQASIDLLADLSHEMRTPLNAVIGFSETMRNETFGPLGDDKYRDYAGIIEKSGRHLLDLVNSILDLARFEAKSLKIKPAPGDLGEIATECVQMLRGEAEAAGLSLTLEIAPHLPRAAFDPQAVRQILINLLSNAVKFTREGGVHLHVGADKAGLYAIVQDTGVGMGADELARLGARFTAVQGDGVRGAKGAGLGLALAFALAEAHDGSLDLESAPGAGLTASLRLPLVRVDSLPVRPNSQQKSSPEKSSQQKLAASPKRAAPRRAASGAGVARIGATLPQAPSPSKGDGLVVQSQLDRIEAYRREIQAKKNAAA